MHQHLDERSYVKLNVLEILLYVGILTPILIFPFSPLVSFLFCILTLFFGSSILTQSLRIIISITGISSLAFIYGSINFLEAIELDLSIYYNAYFYINSNAYNSLKEAFFGIQFFTDTYEFGILLLYKIYSIVFDELSPYDLAVYNELICGIATIIWFELYGSKYVSKRYQALCVAFILLFMSMNTFGFLQRQALSTVFILFALEAKNRKTLITFTALAFIFHTTSLPIIIIWRFLFKKKLTLNVIFGSFIAFLSIRMLFQYIALYLFNIGFQKANFYVFSNTFTIASMRFLALIMILVAANIYTYRMGLHNKWKAPVTIMGIFYICFIGVQLFSERVNFIFLFLYGFFLIVTLPKAMLRYLMLPFFLYLVFFISEKTNIINESFDPYWSRYPIFSLEPFYFLFN